MRSVGAAFTRTSGNKYESTMLKNYKDNKLRFTVQNVPAYFVRRAVEVRGGYFDPLG